MRRATGQRTEQTCVHWIVAFLAMLALALLLGRFTSTPAIAASPVILSIDRSLHSTNPINPTSAITYTYLPIIHGGIEGVLKPKVTRFALTLPQPLEPGVNSFCTWEWCTLSPRLYHEPLANGSTLVGWTDAGGNGQVSVIANNTLASTFTFPAQKVRGLVAHADGKFAVLLWDAATKIMWLSKRNTNGSAIWTVSIDDSLTSHNNGWVGDSRLTYGNGLYAAYFGVHCDTGWCQGHEGDQLTYINDSGGNASGGWQWGCSHSMAELINYHPGLNQFVPVCSSDCYASKGILLNDNQSVYAGDGNCGGMVSSQLGQVAHSGTTWKLVFNAVNRPGYTGRGIGFATVNSAYSSSYVWLTNTTGDYERDPSLARLGTTLTMNRYLVGWMTSNDSVYYLGVVDGNGGFIAGPEEISSLGFRWGNRDDSFRTASDGTVTWVQGDASSTALYLYRFNGAAYGP